MNSSVSRIASPYLQGIALVLALSACSSDKSNPSGTGGAAGFGAAAGAAGTVATGGMMAATGGMSAATGGMTAAGGALATGGTTAAAGGGGGGGAGGSSGGAAGAAGGGGMGGDPYVCFANLSKRDPGGMGKMGDACCSGVGKCSDPATLTGDAAKAYGHDTCGATLKCAPPMTTTPPAKCTTKVGVSAATLASNPDGQEGRCVPKCFLLGNPQAPLLDPGSPACPTDQVCAPCYSPVDGKSTGACNTGTDMPTKPAPMPYQTCPQGDGGVAPYPGGGLCVPGATVMSLSDPNNPLYNPAIPDLKQDNCAMGEKCVPAAKAADPGHCSAKCTTVPQLVNIKYGEGACTAEYVIYDTNGAAGITIAKGMGGMGGMGSGCAADELCAPCGNPLRPPMPSGACY